MTIEECWKNLWRINCELLCLGVFNTLISRCFNSGKMNSWRAQIYVYSRMIRLFSSRNKVEGELQAALAYDAAVLHLIK
jgi:hypothetical protein